MTFLTPAWLFLGALASATLVALHLLAVGRPAPMTLPTARFVPARNARARRLARRPADRLLLAMRVAAVAAAALALAHPVRMPTRRAVARVVLADRSHAARDVAEVRDSVRTVAAAGDVVIAFDGAPAAPTTLDATTRDSVLRSTLATAAATTGSLSAALVAARRAAPTLRDAADSIELVVVSPLTAHEVDAATLATRAAWSGRARIVRVAPAPADTAAPSLRVVARRAGVDDVMQRLAHAGTTPGVRIVRDGVTPADEAWARDSAGVVLDWPLAGAPASWATRAPADTVGAVVAHGPDGDAALVAPMSRTATAPDGGRTVARWADGTPAATERPVGRGCVRSVGVPVAQTGDLGLRPTFAAFVAALAGPCGDAAVGRPLDDEAARRLAGAGPLLAARTLAARPADRDALPRWLLAAAILLLVAEPLARRVGRPAEASDDVASAPAPRRAA